MDAMHSRLLARVHGLESTRQYVVVPRPQVVEPETAVEPLATIEVSIRDRPGTRDRHAECVELVGVAYRAGGVGREANVSVAVIAVESRCPLAAGELVLADALQTACSPSAFNRRSTPLLSVLLESPIHLL
jgi:hypothetical protein